jgi:drug/metabolite transporter (DMT)-like permease
MTLAHLAAAMMIGSGAAHAVVNAILKSGQDKMSSRALIDGFSAVLILPFVPFLPLPHDAWLWLLGSWLTHLIYLICLVKAFEGADMSAVYPVMRGSAPVLAAGGAVGLFGEPISGPVIVGVGMVSAGTLLIALGRHASGKAVAWALATGLTIAAYTVIDAQGVRAAPSAPSYIAWVFLTMGAGVGGLFALWRGPKFVLEARAQWKPGLAAGALSILTYGLALWAYRLGAVPQLAALRETSILFAAVIAVLFLKERVTAARAAGILAIGGGAILLVGFG